jgi:hypothetical protein
MHLNFDSACGKVWVLRAFRAVADESFNLDDPLRANILQYIECLWGYVRIGHYLYQAKPVTQIQEDNPSMVTAAMHPTC